MFVCIFIIFMFLHLNYWSIFNVNTCIHSLPWISQTKNTASFSYTAWPLTVDPSPLTVYRRPFTFDPACLCVISVHCHACRVICLDLESQIHVSSAEQLQSSQRQSQYETPTLISAASHRSSLDSGRVSSITIFPSICITVFVINTYTTKRHPPLLTHHVTTLSDAESQMT